MSSNYRKDPDLGRLVRAELEMQALEGPYKPENETSPAILENYAHNFLSGLGLDTENPSTKETSHRLAKMYREELCYGINYDKFPALQLVKDNADEIVLERNIEVHSMCEHHFVPIIGRAHVAYIPNGQILGLSKINRIVEFFSRRPQVQERLTQQVVATIAFVTKSPNVACIIEADHFCVKFRGVEDPCSDTVTSVMKGVFKTKPEARAELLQLIQLGKGSRC